MTHKIVARDYIFKPNYPYCVQFNEVFKFDDHFRKKIKLNAHCLKIQNNLKPFLLEISITCQIFFGYDFKLFIRVLCSVENRLLAKI